MSDKARSADEIRALMTPLARQHNQESFDKIVAGLEDAYRHALTAKSRGKQKALEIANRHLEHMKTNVRNKDAVAASVASFWAGVAAMELQDEFVKDALRNVRQKGQRGRTRAVKTRNAEESENLRPFLEERLKHYLAQRVPTRLTRNEAYSAILVEVRRKSKQKWTLNRVRTLLQKPQQPISRKSS